MARIKLTAGRIRDHRCPQGKDQAFLWDSEAPGLGVRSTSAGASSFVFQSKLAGQSIRTTIGDCRTWGIDDARQEARRLQGLVDLGRDPRIVRRETIAEHEAKRAEAARQDVTLAEAWPVYVEDRRKQWGVRHLSDHLRMVHPGGQPKKRGQGMTKPGPLAPLLDIRLPEIAPERVKAWAKSEASRRGTQAQLAFGALRAFVNWCNAHPNYRGLIPSDACGSRVKRESLPRKGAKGDCLQREQLAAWFEAVHKIKNPVVSAYLQGLLLTGARREELTHLRWEDVDFRWQSLTIRDKVEGERTIPLTPYVAALLEPLPRVNIWVFSSPSAGSGRLQEARGPHNRALAAAGIQGLTLHGLRRSFGTLSEWMEVPAGVVAQIMGHKPSATAEKHYRVRPLDLLRMWHVKIETWILQQAKIEFSGNGKN